MCRVCVCVCYSACSGAGQSVVYILHDVHYLSVRSANHQRPRRRASSRGIGWVACFIVRRVRNPVRVCEVLKPGSLMQQCNDRTFQDGLQFTILMRVLVTYCFMLENM